MPAQGWAGVFHGNGSGGCLFRIDADPTEQTDLAQGQPALAAAMLASIVQINATTFSPYRGAGEADVAAACAAAEAYGGFFGPFAFD